MKWKHCIRCLFLTEGGGGVYFTRVYFVCKFCCKDLIYKIFLSYWVLLTGIWQPLLVRVNFAPSCIPLFAPL